MSDEKNNTVKDLSRWNRGGLNQFRYVDGNAATYFENIRESLQNHFPEWDVVNVSSENETEDEKAERVRSQYQLQTKDMLVEVARTFSRSCHVLTEHVNAFANEKYLGTATQWENIRRLVAMLDYYPSPPASATTNVALLVKEGKKGTVDKGLAFRYAPEDGSKPQVFETIEKLDVDSNLNALRVKNYNCNLDRLKGNTLTISGEYKKLKAGEPLVLESENGFNRAYLISSVKVTEDRTTITLTDKVSEKFTKGKTKIHLMPKEKLDPYGPISKVAQVGKTIHLKSAPEGLVKGNVVAVYNGHKHRYHYIKEIIENRVTFETNIGQVNHAASKLQETIILPIVRYASRPVKKNKSYLMVLLAAGDWSYLAKRKVADCRMHKNESVLVHYDVVGAKYTPVGAEENSTTKKEGAKPGFTMLTVSWTPEHDFVDTPHEVLSDLKIRNPQILNVPANTGKEWDFDPFLSKSENGKVLSNIAVSEPKQLGQGDFAVICRGGQLAWSKLSAVKLDADNKMALITTNNGWQDCGGGPFFLSDTKVYGSFKETAVPIDAEENNRILIGKTIYIDELKTIPAKGRKILLQAEDNLFLSYITKVENNLITIAENIPNGFSISDTKIYVNVATISQGETKSSIVLGSGDATRVNQNFVVNVSEISFIPDSSMSSGVKADIQVQVGDQVWTQVSTLNDSNSASTHYVVRMGEDGNIKIEFGDGEKGRRLPTGKNNIRLTYRQGVGSQGNIPAYSFDKPSRQHPLVEKVHQPIETFGGHGLESSSEMANNAPGAVLSLERAVSTEDFSKLAISHTSVLQANSFMRSSGKNRRRFVDVVIVPVGGTGLEYIKDQIKEFLLKHSIPGVMINILEYKPIIVGFNVTVRADLEKFDAEKISEEVKQNIINAFSLENRSLGESMHRGELYKIVENSDGVSNSDCTISLADSADEAIVPEIIKGNDEVIRAINPSPKQVVHLDIDRPEVSITVEDYRV